MSPHREATVAALATFRLHAMLQECCRDLLQLVVLCKRASQIGPRPVLTSWHRPLNRLH